MPWEHSHVGLPVFWCSMVNSSQTWVRNLNWLPLWAWFNVSQLLTCQPKPPWRSTFISAPCPTWQSHRWSSFHWNFEFSLKNTKGTYCVITIFKWAVTYPWNYYIPFRSKDKVGGEDQGKIQIYGWDLQDLNKYATKIYSVKALQQRSKYGWILTYTVDDPFPQRFSRKAINAWFHPGRDAP
jgi:hypothetical protein